MRKWMIVISSTVAVLLVIVCGGLYYYQSTHFNSNIQIDNTEVGGLTAEKALDKLKSTVSKHVIFVGGKKVYDGEDTQMGFTDQDLKDVKHLLKKQKTFFPSGKAQNYMLRPIQANAKQNESLENGLKAELEQMNKSLKAPKDAAVHLENGSVVVSKSVAGQQYDVSKLLKSFSKQNYNSEIHLNPIYKQPIKADNPIIEKEKKKLKDLAKQTIDYKVQDKVYSFKGSDLIHSVSVSKDMKLDYKIDTAVIKNKLKTINDSQSTLHKNYSFTTHSGKKISVKGESYGWALDVDSETKRIKDAFSKGKQSISAYNVYGEGWNVNGVGYHTTTNHGIGDTYVEVSIKDQRIWVYKDGKLKVTTHVVTGTHIYNEDTPKGVWYIEYKESPSTLTGSEVGNPNYSVKVQYWAPFTLSGCGLHDASWRSNWSSDAYIKYGSGGCVNTPPSVMKTVYDNVSQYEPVVVY